MDPASTQMVVLNQIGEWSAALLDQARAALIALVIFMVGLALSELAKYLGELLLRALRWDNLCDRLGLTAVLRKYRADLTPSAATGNVLFWIVLVSFSMQALERLNVAGLAGLGRAYFALLPAAGEAAIILLLAWVAARGLARLILAAVEHPAAFLGAGLAQSLVLALGLFASLMTLGVDRGLAQPVALILLAAAAFGVALGWSLNHHALFRPVTRLNDSGEEE